MFEKSFPVVLKFEGGFVDHPRDPGGATNKGITQETYNKYRKVWQLPPQHVRYISDTEVRKIYESFWRNSKSDIISERHPLTSLTHYDFAINAGPRQAIKTLQRAIGGINIDGIIGPKTLAALNLSNDYFLASDYNEQRRLFYQNLVKKKPQLTVFLRGWLYRVNKIEAIIDDWRAQSNQSTNPTTSIT